MNEDQVLDALRSVRFLSEIGDVYLKAIAAQATVRDIPANAVIFREGQPHPDLYLVVDGAVALEMRVRPQVLKRLQTVGAGELLGWSPMLGPSEMTATARTLNPCRVIAVNGAQLMAMCEHDPRFGFEFMRRVVRALAGRLNATRLQILDVYSQELPAFTSTQEV